MTATGSSGWAIVLGASSGMGAACATELARAGLDIAGVHLDRRATLAQAEAVRAEVERAGRRAAFFNVNAADPLKRREVLDALQARFEPSAGQAPVRVLVHSLAFGTLKPLCAADAAEQASAAQLAMTLDVMASSLVGWVQDVAGRGWMGEGGRVFALTSEGSSVAWPSYGPVSAAKAALESYCRQLAVELAPKGITVNAIRAGVTDTPALRKIPGWEALIEQARRRNPSGRLTTPMDVARCVVALIQPGTAWLTGNVLGVDGGEHVAGL